VAQSVDGLKVLPLADIDNAQPREKPGGSAGSLADPVLIIYTSGTTGRPKGAVLTQQALVTNAIGSVDLHKMAADDRVLVVLPLFHVGGLTISLTPALYAGATVELHSRFDPGQTLEAIERFRPQVLVLVPATMMAVMKLPGWTDADTSSLRVLTTGSMVVPVELIAAFEDKGISVVQVYGSTETCPIAAYTQPGEGRSNPETTGKAGCCSQTRIVDANGRAIDTPDVDGEIEIRGDHVMQGYWNSRRETADAFNGDWYRTGDIGSIDAEGNLYFRERARHTIVSGGENIYPAEVERVLTAIPGVAEAAVCGIADEQWGEVPAAGIVLAPDSEVTQGCIEQALARELARFKHPKQIT
ncbi:MAG: class I adenylate-forming enzyme family protein, partial [Aestuariivirgaceae bacterium]